MAALQVYANASERLTPAGVAAHAQRAEALGYDGLSLPEAVHDGLVVSTLALQATERLKVVTGVLVAFVRSPMALAMAAWDLQSFSGGRFELGLGAQVKGNVEGRYAAAWSPPVKRMREFVTALRATFDCWQNGTKLEFEGEIYRLTRMQPFFNPGPIDHPDIPIILGAVGPGMLKAAGKIADGLVTHPTNTHPRYIDEVIRPRLRAGADAVARETEPVIHATPMCATGVTEAQVKERREGLRQTFSFLFSTRQYWASLELFGWREQGEHLLKLSREGKWDQMPGVVTDEILDTLVPTAVYAELPDVLREWYDGRATQVMLPMPEDPSEDDAARDAIARLKAD